MQLRTDTSVPAIVRIDTLDWTPSPQPGVDRKLLARDGAEVARATSIVRYAPGASFPAHQHPGGEEFFVLRGVFSDEHGDYPAGTYSRSPWGSTHAPFSRDGCEIFVKLCHLPSDAEPWLQPLAPSIEPEPPLFDGPEQRVWIERTATTARPIAHPPSSMLEALLVAGSLRVGERHYRQRTWVRLPADDRRPLELGAASTLWLQRTWTSSGSRPL